MSYTVVWFRSHLFPLLFETNIYFNYIHPTDKLMENIPYRIIQNMTKFHIRVQQMNKCMRGRPSRPLHRNLQWSIVLCVQQNQDSKAVNVINKIQGYSKVQNLFFAVYFVMMSVEWLMTSDDRRIIKNLAGSSMWSAFAHRNWSKHEKPKFFIWKYMNWT
jgi:hypothetical protein